MAALTTQVMGVAGLAPTFAAAAGGGDTVAASNNVFFVVKNGGGSPITATVVVPGNTSYGQPLPDIAYTVTNGTELWIPLSTEYQDTATGRISITYSGVTSVTVAAITR